MPHLIIEYSENLESDFDPPTLAKKLTESVVGTGVFPLSGTRIRFHPVKHYRVSNNDPDNAFIHLMIRMGYGRDLATRKRAGSAIFDALRGHFETAYQRRPMAISLEIVEINPDLSFKQNNLATYLNR